jgi:hypothetical protein
MRSMDKHKGQSEREAVHTAIVGAIPRGIEVLVKKASVDPEFREVLLEKRAEAAKEIELELADSEADMLASIPQAQLEAIIANTKVKPESRRLFLGKAAGIMLAALGVGAAGCREKRGQSAGIQPDRSNDVNQQGQEQQTPQQIGVAGIMPNDSEEANKISRGISPRRPSATKGIQPDRPE